MDAIFHTGLYAVLWLLALRGHALDCQHAQAQCTEDRTCAVMLMMVPDLCGNPGSETTCDAPDRLQCEGILQILRQSQHFRGCSCDTLAVNYQECQAVYSQLYREQCTDSDEEVVQEVPTQPVQDPFAVSPWQYMANVDQVGPAPTGESTCIEALNACNVDATCRQSLYEYLTECRGDPVANTCKMTACRHSIRAFLDAVSPRYTHPLLYCYCASDDTQCDTVWQGLNAECAYMLTPLPSCIDVQEQCSRSSLCSTNFENYKFQCAVSDATGTGCAQSYGACRDARLGILGTIVAASCTCRGVEGSDLDACKQQQLIVLDNPCFARASQAYYPSAKNQDGAHTTAQPQIHVNKRVKDGCVVRLWNGYPDVHVATGHNIRIASDDFAACTQICRCVAGYLSQCFDVLCNVTQPCNEGARISHEGSKECVCTGREQICIDTKMSLHVDAPAMVIGYSVIEREFIERQLHVRVTAQTVVSKLQQALSGVFSRNPCELKTVTDTHVNGTLLDGRIVIVAHSERNNTKNYWECMNQLNDVVAMINSRAPPIASDVILSMIKIASLIEGAPEKEETGAQISYTRSGATRVVAMLFILQCLPFVLLLVTPKLY